MDELGLANEFTAHRLSLAVADGDLHDRQFAVSLAKNLGHEIVIEAESGDELILACDEHRIDVALLGVDPQGSDTVRIAVELLSRLRIPAILMSRHGPSCDLDPTRNAGVFGLLAKPLTASALSATLQMARFDFCLWKPGLEIRSRPEVRRQAQTDILLAIAKLACEMNISTQSARRQLEDFAWEHCQTPLEAAGAVLAHLR